MTTSPVDIADAIERFIRTEFQVADGDPLFTRDAHLFDAGFVDSIAFVQLISFIESTFEVSVDEDVLMSEDFTTINAMSRAVASQVVRCCC